MSNPEPADALSLGRDDTALDPLAPRTLATYPVRTPCLTRWSDNDMYGHLNNAKYYELFDTAINTWIAEVLGTDFAGWPAIGVVAESSCRFHAELAFPGSVTIGLRIRRLGTSSVTYDLAIFEGPDPGDLALAAATARWVHVYIDRETRMTTPIPAPLRVAAEQVRSPGETQRAG